MFRKIRFRSEGATAAQQMGEVARGNWPFFPNAMYELGVTIPVDPRGSAAKAFKVFVVDYTFQNLWRAQLTDEDCVPFIQGIGASLDSNETRMWDRLLDTMEGMVVRWGHVPPRDVYVSSIGDWYVDCSEIAVTSLATLPIVGRCLVEQTRQVVRSVFPTTD